MHIPKVKTYRNIFQFANKNFKVFLLKNAYKKNTIFFILRKIQHLILDELNFKNTQNLYIIINPTIGILKL